MISTTRRQTLVGAVVVPTLAGLPRFAWAYGDKALAVYDSDLVAGRQLAEVHGGDVLAIEGDRIRFARAVFERKPSLVVGVSRPADALLIEDVGREAGFVRIDSGAKALRDMIDAARSRDRGLVLGWLLAPRV